MNDNSEKKQIGRRFQPGQSGNPKGKPPGSRHRATLIAQQLLDGQAQELAQVAIRMALEGDTVALRLCLERLVPPAKERPVTVPDLPELQTPEDATKVLSDLLRRVAAGEVLPSEATALAGLVAEHRKAVEMVELENRLAALEAAQSK